MYYKNKKTIPSTKKNSTRWVLLAAMTALVVLLMVGGLYYFLTKHTTKPVTTTASSTTKGEPSTDTSQDKTPVTSPTPSTTNPSSSQSGDKGNTSGTSSTTLLEPTGNFVSNHHPNLSGKPAPNEIQSTCNTTPGATCQILFTKDSITKSLPPQTTDNGGATYWTKTLQDIGLTAGSWHVQAKAMLGSQTKTEDDALALVVNP